MALVQSIGERHRPVRAGNQLRFLLRGSLVEPFFLVGIVAGVFGSVVLGGTLWLMRSGVIPISDGYGWMRQWHAVIQLHFFLGVCMVGFLLQASPRLLDSRVPIPRGAVAILLLFLGAGLLLSVDGRGIAWRVLLSLAYAVTALLVVRVASGASSERRLRIAAPFILGLVGFILAAWGDLVAPSSALFHFWVGPAPVLAAAAQQFLGGVLGHPPITMRAAGATLTCYLVSILGLGWALTHPGSALFAWRIAAVFGSATILGYLCSSSIMLTWRRSCQEPLALVCTLSAFWLVVSAILLCLGPSGSDALLHLLATGIAVPLLLVVTSRIMNFFSEREVLGDRAVLRLLLVWQLVPVGRGLGSVFAAPTFISWLVVAAVTVVVVYWSQALVFGIVRSLRLKWRLGEEAPAARC